MTRRQRLWFPAMVLVMAVVAAACGSDDEPTVAGGGSGQTTTPAPTFPAGSAMANIQAKGKLVVGTKFDQPGLGVKNPTNNKLAGCRRPPCWPASLPHAAATTAITSTMAGNHNRCLRVTSAS